MTLGTGQRPSTSEVVHDAFGKFYHAASGRCNVATSGRRPHDTRYRPEALYQRVDAFGKFLPPHSTPKPQSFAARLMRYTKICRRRNKKTAASGCLRLSKWYCNLCSSTKIAVNLYYFPQNNNSRYFTNGQYWSSTSDSSVSHCTRIASINGRITAQQCSASARIFA
jgi:hypothetical protein